MRGYMLICIQFVEKLPESYPGCLHHFLVPPAMYETGFSASPPAVSINTVFYFSCFSKCIVVSYHSLNLHFPNR